MFTIIMIFDYIDPLIFLISLGVGVFIAYILNPNPTIVHKYPTPENSKKLTYVDDQNVCYKYHTQEVPKPNDTENVTILEEL